MWNREMSKKYTAEEMRKVAKSFFCNEVCLDFDKRDIANMLRHAAEMLECNRYEYAEMYSNGDVSHEKGDSIDDVNRFLSDGSVIVRRKVGEWEECDEN